MPIIGGNNDEMVTLGSTGGYQYSGMDLDVLAAKGASDYTLATIVVDVSGSIYGFQQDEEAALKAMVEALQAAPRADNLLLRVLTFDDQISEIHGFKLLTDVNQKTYDGTIKAGSTTNLFGAAYDGVAALLSEGERLVNDGYRVNAIIVVITDGMDNCYQIAPGQVKALIEGAITGETLESIRAILIGVNEHSDASGSLSGDLNTFKVEAGFDQYVGVGDASAKALRKLADFVSKSISSQSQALGSGGPSQALTL